MERSYKPTCFTHSLGRYWAGGRPSCEGAKSGHVRSIADIVSLVGGDTKDCAVCWDTPITVLLHIC